MAAPQQVQPHLTLVWRWMGVRVRAVCCEEVATQFVD
jgi:hypothetical protein